MDTAGTTYNQVDMEYCSNEYAGDGPLPALEIDRDRTPASRPRPTSSPRRPTGPCTSVGGRRNPTPAAACARGSGGRRSSRRRYPIYFQTRVARGHLVLASLLIADRPVSALRRCSCQSPSICGQEKEARLMRGASRDGGGIDVREDAHQADLEANMSML